MRFRVWVPEYHPPRFYPARGRWGAGALPADICTLRVFRWEAELSRQMALVRVGESDVKFMSQMVFSKFHPSKSHPERSH